MKVVEKRVLRGPNVHTWRPCVQLIIDLEDLDKVSSADVPGFSQGLRAVMPSLFGHRCSVGVAGGFLQRLEQGTYMAHVVEHVVLELQCLAGSPAGFGRARKIRRRPRCYRVVCAYQIEALIDPTVDAAIEVVATLAAGSVPDVERILTPLRAVVAKHAPGPSTASILKAAKRRNIPFLRLNQHSSLYQLGYASQQQRFQATITGLTGQISTRIASDKQLVRRLLEQAGVPVPKGCEVRSGAEAARAAARLGGHVVVKPADANQGKGVSTGLTDPDSIAVAFEHARQYSQRVLVEQFISGNDYRILIVSNKMVAAARRDPAYVVGDGRTSIEDLVALENTNPQRGYGHGKPLTRIPTDEHTQRHLARHGWALESVPTTGCRVTLCDTANLSTGGTAIDVTEQVHPQVAWACVRAARVIGLDVAGVDLVCRDIGLPLDTQQGAILEINAAPGIRMHEFPSAGKRRAAGRAIVDHLFPHSDGRVPIIAITGTNGKTTTSLLVAAALHATGRAVGVATTNGITVQGQQIRSGDCTGLWSARAVLSDPQVELAVLETARGGIARRGLGFDRCDVAVVTNVSDDHLGQDGITTVRQLAQLKAVVARSARRALVLNAQDDRCVAMASQRRKGVELIYFSLDAGEPVIQQHIAQGGRGVFVMDDAVVLVEGGTSDRLFSVSELSVALGGKARHNVGNVLAAVAALVAAGQCSRQDIVDAMTGFASSAAASPVRLNLYQAQGVTILLDYAHNPAAYSAILETARSLGHSRIVGVIGAPADRDSAQLQRIGEICADHLDEIIAYDPDNARGRARGATATALATAAISRTQGRIPVDKVIDVREAVRAGLDRCQPGDLLLFGGATQLSELHDALASVVVSELSTTVKTKVIHYE